MSCLFDLFGLSRSRCCTSSPVRSVQTISYATGIVGPTGPTGPSGSNIVAEFISTASTSSVQPTLALLRQYPTDQTSMTLGAESSILLDEGYYLINYGTQFTSTSAGDTPSISIIKNSTTEVQTTLTGKGETTNALSGSYLFLASQGDKIGLNVGTSATTSYTNTFIVIQKIGE